MRAAVVHAQAPVEASPLVIEEVAEPSAGADEVKIRVHACGVCHTDLHIAEGDMPLVKTPVIPGHQIVGTIESVGEEVAAERVGERVGVPWMSSSCGVCGLCRAGRENLCGQSRFTGYHVDGGFAEYAVAPSSAAHPLPPSFADENAAPLLCAGIIGYRSLRLAEVEPGKRLGLYGFGASAHLAIQVARYWGCEVFVFTRGRHHRELAEQLGAVWVGDARDEPPAKLDSAITFAPVGWIVPEALRALAPAGTLAINAVHLDGVPALDYQKHLYWEKTLRSVANLTHEDARQFLELAGEIPIETTVETFPLEDANEALRQLKLSKIEAAAALMM
jgi:propanol-preferring alcohol dehydrogenase